jgi:hypothetical protein
MLQCLSYKLDAGVIAELYYASCTAKKRVAVIGVMFVSFFVKVFISWVRLLRVGFM